MEGPLAGSLVVDVSATAPGPYCTSILARLGARVVKFEPPGGDPARRFPAVFEALNRGKESAVVDLSVPEDLGLVRSAVSRADVFVEGWRPGVAASRGLGPEALVQENPRLVYCSVSGYGGSGPLRSRPGHDVNFVAASGMARAVSRDREPRALGAPLADLAGGTFAALAVLAALLEARTTGRGRHVDVSLAGAMAEWVAAMGGPEGLAVRSIADTVPGYGIYRTADGRHLSLGVVYEDRFWSDLCGVLGMDDHAAPAFEERLGRDDLRAEVARRVASIESGELEAALTDAGLPWAWVEPPGAVDRLGLLAEPPASAPSPGAHTQSVRSEFS